MSVISDSGGPGEAHQAVLRLLRVALPNEARCEWALHGALAAARRAELPSEPREVMQFVRTHLAPQLSGVIAPSRVLGLLDDLAEELERQATRGGPTKSARMRAVTSPPRPGLEGPAGGETGKLPFPKLRQSFGKLARPPSTRMRAVRFSGIEAKPAPLVPREISLSLVDCDRLARASMARALVTAKFQPSVYDSVADLRVGLGCEAQTGVAVIHLRREDRTEIHGLASAHPGLALLAWTAVPRAVCEGMLMDAGVRRFDVVSRGLSHLDIVEAVKRIASADPAAAGGARVRSS